MKGTSRSTISPVRLYISVSCLVFPRFVFGFCSPFLRRPLSLTSSQRAIPPTICITTSPFISPYPVSIVLYIFTSTSYPACLQHPRAYIRSTHIDPSRTCLRFSFARRPIATYISNDTCRSPLIRFSPTSALVRHTVAPHIVLVPLSKLA